MPEVDSLLEAFCSGRASLAATQQALSTGLAARRLDAADLKDALERFTADGRIASSIAAMLLGSVEQPEEPAGLTLLRPAGSTSRGEAGAPSIPQAHRDTSGASAANWRKWAAEDIAAVPIGVGTVLRERFLIEEIIGEGGMGLVFRARDRRREEANDRNPFVAIKVLGEEFKTHPDALIALQREARRMQQLSHPNIASVYDFDRDGSHVFLVMELLQGESLDRVLEQTGKAGLAPEQARKVIEAAGSALRHAHSKGLVHSDFKPANVFLTREGEVKVIDFGIARIAKDTTQAGDAAHTVFDAGRLGAWTNSYASPEQMLDGATPDARDDIYALGLVAYEVLSGRHPFGRKSAIEAKFNDLKVERLPALNDRQNAVLASALHFDRNQRLGDIVEFVESLGSETGEVISAYGRIGQKRAQEALDRAAPGKRISRIVALSVVGVAWLGFLAFYWMARDEDEKPAAPVAGVVAESGTPANETPSGLEAPQPEPVPRGDVVARAAPSPPAMQPPVPAVEAVARPPAEAGGAAAVAAEAVVPPDEEASGEPAAIVGAGPDTNAEPSQETVATVDAADAPGSGALYKWTDRDGQVQFGEKPPAEYAEAAVKVMDL